MSLARADSPHVARADLTAVAMGVGDDDGVVVGVEEYSVSIVGAAADPQA
jgi:hypothetical protein